MSQLIQDFTTPKASDYASMYDPSNNVPVFDPAKDPNNSLAPQAVRELGPDPCKNLLKAQAAIAEIRNRQDITPKQICEEFRRVGIVPYWTVQAGSSTLLLNLMVGGATLTSGYPYDYRADKLPGVMENLLLMAIGF